MKNITSSLEISEDRRGEKSGGEDYIEKRKDRVLSRGCWWGVGSFPTKKKFVKNKEKKSRRGEVWKKGTKPIEHER